MSAVCPYCGAKLNLGLKFCVVCGRHVTQDRALGKLGGLKTGFRPADITRRLDELITVARFKRSRRDQVVERSSRWLFLNVIYLVVFSGLFYTAIQFSLEMLYPGKFKETRIPVAKIMTFMQQKASDVHTRITELTAPPGEPAPPVVTKPQPPAPAASPAKPQKPASKKKTKKSRRSAKKKKAVAK